MWLFEREETATALTSSLPSCDDPLSAPPPLKRVGNTNDRFDSGWICDVFMDEPSWAHSVPSHVFDASRRNTNSLCESSDTVVFKCEPTFQSTVLEE